MILLTVDGLRKYYGTDPVLDGVSFDVRQGERIALVGPNGAGKTTLLRILTGGEESDAGSIDRPSDLRLGYLEQQPQFPAGQTIRQTARHAMKHLLELVEESESVAEQLATVPDPQARAKLGERFDRLQHSMQQQGAYQIENKIEKVLTGLGFPTEQFEQPVEQLSGGQQNRLMLAALLLEEPDLLLLDEPSNHLDIAATQWLEDYLIEASPSLILVSHDRYFLDRVTTRTWELFHGTVDSYRGNYSAYVRQKAERLEVKRRTYEKQQVEIDKMEDFVRRHHHGQKHAQAEDRRKKLARLERVEPPREISVPPMQFPPASRTGDVVLRVENLSKAFDEPLFQDASFDLLRGEKWGILGPNGSGKTTLIRCLLGEVQPDTGQVSLGAGVQIGYFDQLLRCLPEDVQVVDAIRPSNKDFVEQQRRDLLARFGILGDMAFQPVRSLSGGERNRVALSMLAASDANFLILDEPTNHLDLWARESLEKSLRMFAGTVLFVSHDRYFLNQVADHLLVVESPRLRVIEGNYDTYRHFVKEGLAQGQQDLAGLARGGALMGSGTPAPGGKNSSAGTKTRDKPPRRKRKFPYRKVPDLERDIAEREERVQRLHQQLATPDVLRDGEKVKQCKSDLDACQQELEQLYEHWEEAVELNG